MTKNPIYKYQSVMLVDDNEIDNIINQKMIEATAFAEKIYVFGGSMSALDFLKNLDKANGISQENIPSLLFLDINMPMLDGFQFLDEFNKLSKNLKSQIKILMLSSSISERDLNRASDSPFIVQYVNKPLSIPTLKEINI